MAPIIRSAQLPVSAEINLAEIAPPSPGFLPPQGRMDLVVTDSDFHTILADVTITHPCPSENQAITQPMLNQGYFSAYRERTNKPDDREARTGRGHFVAAPTFAHE